MLVNKSHRPPVLPEQSAAAEPVPAATLQTGPEPLAITRAPQVGGGHRAKRAASTVTGPRWAPSNPRRPLAVGICLAHTGALRFTNLCPPPPMPKQSNPHGPGVPWPGHAPPGRNPAPQGTHPYTHRVLLFHATGGSEAKGRCETPPTHTSYSALLVKPLLCLLRVRSF